MKLVRRALLFLIVAGCCSAQNSDLAILFSATVARFDFGTRTETQYRIGLQANYAWQLLERPAGRLYLELPVSSFAGPVGQGSITDLGPVREIARPERVVFATPGLRYHLNLTPRIVLYAAGGVGVAIRQRKVFTVGTAPTMPGVSPLYGIRTGWNGRAAFDLGAGLDFRLTRLLSVRGEFRNFRTSSVAGYGTGRQYPSAHVGFAFHF